MVVWCQWSVGRKTPTTIRRSVCSCCVAGSAGVENEKEDKNEREGIATRLYYKPGFFLLGLAAYLFVHLGFLLTLQNTFVSQYAQHKDNQGYSEHRASNPSQRDGSLSQRLAANSIDA